MDKILKDKAYSRGLMLGLSIPLSRADDLLQKMRSDAKTSPKKAIWDILIEGYESGIKQQKERLQKRKQELEQAKKSRGRGKGNKGRSR